MSNNAKRAWALVAFAAVAFALIGAGFYFFSFLMLPVIVAIAGVGFGIALGNQMFDIQDLVALSLAVLLVVGLVVASAFPGLTLVGVGAAAISGGVFAGRVIR